MTLTGVNEFSTDNSGNWTGQIWDTRGNVSTAYGLWMINGGFGGAFINGPNMANAPINVSLPNGTYTFSFHGDPGSDSRWGMNLFFNGSTSVPGISVFAAEKTGISMPAFSPNTSTSTPALYGSPALATVAAANSRSFASGGQAVTITAYQWSSPSVLNVDRVSPSSTTGNGLNDYTGQITLGVYSISSNTWTGFAADDNWSSAGNWTADGGHDGVAPANDGTANVIFAGSNRTTPYMNSQFGWNVASVAFDNTADAFTIQGFVGQGITVQSGGVTNNSNHSQTIQTAVLLGASQTWTAATGNLTISGNIGLQGNNLTIAGPFTSATTLSGQLTDYNGLSGALIKNGTGTLTLSGSAPNIYGGPTIVNQGVLQLGKTTTNATITGSSLTIGQAAGTSGFVYEYFSDQIGDSTPVTINPSSALYLQGTTSDYLASTTFNGGSVSTGGEPGFISLGTVTTNANSITASVTGRVNQNVGFTWNVAAGTTTSGIDLDVSAEVFGTGSLV